MGVVLVLAFACRIGRNDESTSFGDEEAPNGEDGGEDRVEEEEVDDDDDGNEEANRRRRRKSSRDEANGRSARKAGGSGKSRKGRSKGSCQRYASVQTTEDEEEPHIHVWGTPVAVDPPERRGKGKTGRPPGAGGRAHRADARRLREGEGLD